MLPLRLLATLLLLPLLGCPHDSPSAPQDSPEESTASGSETGGVQPGAESAGSAESVEPERLWLELPRVEAGRAVGAGVLITLDERGVGVEGAEILPLEADGSFAEEHVSGAMVWPLHRHLQRVRDRSQVVALQTGQSWDGVARLAIAPDQPFARVVEVLYTAGQAQFSSFEVVVETGAEEVAALPITLPSLPAPGDPVVQYVTIWAQPGRDPAVAPGRDRAG